MAGLSVPNKPTSAPKQGVSLTKNKSREFMLGEFSAIPIEFMFDKKANSKPSTFDPSGQKVPAGVRQSP